MANAFLDAMVKHGKKAGLEGIETAADGATLKGYLHSGNLALNWIMSGKFTGGWPLAHMIEVFGDPSSGKSFLVARAIAEAFKNEGTIGLLDDTEGAFNATWAATSLGVDVDRLVRVKTHTLEEHYDLVMAFIQAFKEVKAKGPSVLALDSLALLSTKHEVEQGMAKENMARAKTIKKHFRLCSNALQDLPLTYMVTNHQIASMDPFSPPDSSGGGGPKYQASIRLALRKPVPMKDANKRPIGVKINAFVTKNRLVSPWRSCMMIVPFFEPISPVSGLVDLLVKVGALEHTKGKTLAFQGADTGISGHKSDFWKQDQSALDLFQKFPNLMEELEKVDWARAQAGTPMVEDGKDADEEE